MRNVLQSLYSATVKAMVACAVISAPVQADTSSVSPQNLESILEGLHGFECEGNAVPEPIFIIERDGALTGIGFGPFDRITRVDGGFFIQDTEDAGTIAYLVGDGVDWELRGLGPYGSITERCTELRGLIAGVAEALLPHFATNYEHFEQGAAMQAKQLELSQKQVDELRKALDTAVADAERERKARLDVERALAVSEAVTFDLLPTVQAQVLFRLGGYAAPYGYPVYTRSMADVNFDRSSAAADFCLSNLERDDLMPSEACIEQLQGALQPYPGD